MGQTAFPYQAVRGLPAQTLAARNAATAGPLGTVSWSTASTGDVLTVQGDGTVAFAAVSAGIGGSTGSVDNAILRADGTGGATLQACDWIITDNYTSSPNATVNHASIQATGSTTNVSVSIVPKGTGSFSLHVPDGTSAGGNVRGANAIDLQTSRVNADFVASGLASFIGGGSSNQNASAYGVIGGGGSNVNRSGTSYCTVAGGFRNETYSSHGVVCGGLQNSNYASAGFIGGGRYNECLGAYSCIGGGDSNRTEGAYSVVIGGFQSLARIHGMRAHATGAFSARGDAQLVECVLRNKTITNAAVTLFLDGSSARLTIPSGKGMSGMMILKGLKSDGSVGARFVRLIDIKNVGGTTSLETTPETIGTDYNPSGCTLAITADDTNDAAQVNITGIAAETWRWVMSFYGVELAYGT